MAAVPRLVALMSRYYRRSPEQVARNLESYRRSLKIWQQDWENEQEFMQKLIRIALKERHALIYPSEAEGCIPEEGADGSQDVEQDLA